MKHRPKSTGGYTLLEMVVVTAISSIVGLVAWLAIIQSMKVYAQTSPSLHAGYQARLASERMKRNIRDMDPASVSVLTPTALSFDDVAGQPLAFGLSGTDLLENGDLLATGVTGLAFRYWTRAGSPATSANELWLVEIDLTVRAAAQDFRALTVAFPRSLGP